MNTAVLVVSILATGCGATLVMDLWLLLLRRLGVRTASFALIGRWVGHFRHGRFVHAAIAQAAPVRGEGLLGWVVHYAVGIVFAALLVALHGSGWLQAPTVLPAIGFGLASVAAPLLLMQPAMGAGLLAMNTATPLANCLRSTVNHGVFGLGLYLAARLVAWLVA